MISKVLKPIAAIARVTFSEILRDKVLYNILLCAMILFGVGVLGSRLMIARQDRVILDFGLSAVNISCALIAIFTGSGLIGREFDRRTAFVALSRPISRHQFVIGKFGGLLAIVLLNWALLSTVYIGLLYWASPVPEATFTGTLAWALVLIAFQSTLLAGLSILFSSASTTSIAAIVTLGLYLIGNNISQVKMVSGKMEVAVVGSALAAAASVLPNLERFSLGTQATYGIPVQPAFIALGMVYALAVTASALLAAGILVRWRER
jgi:Cu-processing system permease protein